MCVCKGTPLEGTSGFGVADTVSTDEEDPEFIEEEPDAGDGDGLDSGVDDFSSCDIEEPWVGAGVVLSLELEGERACPPGACMNRGFRPRISSRAYPDI